MSSKAGGRVAVEGESEAAAGTAGQSAPRTASAPRFRRQFIGLVLVLPRFFDRTGVAPQRQPAASAAISGSVIRTSSHSGMTVAPSDW